MPNKLLPAQRQKVKLIIHRVGQLVDVLRPDGSATENQFGKIEDGDITRTKVATEYARRIYQTQDSRPDFQIEEGGRRPSDDPAIAMPYGSNVQKDDHLVFPDGATFRVIRSLGRDTYDHYRVETVNG